MITDLFEKNKVLYQKANVPNQLVELQLEERILEYLSCMGKDLYFYVSEYGVALTSLFSVETILEEVFDEYNKPCIENGYLVIGKGPNGDLLCVDIKKVLLDIRTMMIYGKDYLRIFLIYTLKYLFF